MAERHRRDASFNGPGRLALVTGASGAVLHASSVPTGDR
jgi:hypothetical protein